jgi:hypothetical protein
MWACANSHFESLFGIVSIIRVGRGRIFAAAAAIVATDFAPTILCRRNAANVHRPDYRLKLSVDQLKILGVVIGVVCNLAAAS